MTFPTRRAAIAEMAAIFRDAWITTAAQPVDRIKWDNVSGASTPPSGQTPWARFVLRHGPSRQVTLSGVVGQRRFRRTGVLAVQVFTIKGSGLSGTVDLPKIVQDAYEGVTSPNGVIFRDVAVNEVGPSGDFFQTNVTASFEYDEVK